MKIRIDPADKAFSEFIRLRDKKCMRCGREGKPDRNGKMLRGLENSHYFGRRKESVRFDPANCDSLCFYCHRLWETEDREAYRDFKIEQLGKEGFDALKIRANTFKKKDRAMELIIAKQLLKTL